MKSKTQLEIEKAIKPLKDRLKQLQKDFDEMLDYYSKK